MESFPSFLLQIPADAPVFHGTIMLQSRGLICDHHIYVVLLQVQAYIHTPTFR